MTRRSRVVALLAALALATIGVGSGTAPAATRQAPPGQRQGITPTEIRVGGVGGFSVNPVGLPYDQIEDGVRAYFAKINSEGGVFGRQLKIIKMRDDASQPVKNLLQTRALVEQDGVFAVMPVATINFSGAKYLTKKGVPAFGYHISNDWENGPNLFGETGSATCFTCPDPTYPWLAKQLGAKRVGVIGYSVAIAQDCVKWQVASYKKFGVQVPYVNDVLAFGFTVSSFAADVQKIKDAHLDMLSTCMDSNGSLLIKQSMNKAGINIPVQWGEGYNQDFLEKNASDLNGLYLSVSEQPFEDPMPSEGLQNYLQWMQKTNGHVNKISLAGWIDADLFVEGLQRAGKNVTRQKLINTVNKITDFTAHGIEVNVDWSKAHHKDPNGTACRAFLKVESGKFVPVFGQPGKPFVCLEHDVKSLDNFVVRAAGTAP